MKNKVSWFCGYIDRTTTCQVVNAETWRFSDIENSLYQDM